LLGFLIASLFYFMSRRLKLVAIVDLLWSLGMGLGSLWIWAEYSAGNLRSHAVLVIAIFGSIRLSWHIFSDRVFPRVEDGRYAYLKSHWGDAAPRNFYFLFLAQVPVVFLFLLPVYAAMNNMTSVWRITDTSALLLAAMALLGESISDRQLRRFRACSENRGRVCDFGFWRYSRHPNYFFEWLSWWPYVLFSWGSDYFILSLAGPIFMYVFLTRISGIPHTERQALLTRGEAYRKYQETTNSFWPWLPRRNRT